jgi:superfamily II DNA/RNA helicase
VSHIFNYDVPSHAEDYVHRIGRTGRAGRQGKAIMICVPADERNLDDIEKLIDKPIPRLDAPGGIESAPEPEEAVAEEAPRRRSRRPRGEGPAKPAAPREEPKAAAPREEPKAVAPREEPRVAAPAEEPREPVQQPDEGEKRGRRRRGRGEDERVVGMGDHLPSFIAQSFDDRRTG